MGKKSKIKFAGNRLRKIFVWRKFEPMSKWFESNIVLTKGNVRGAFRTRGAPHLVEIFDDLDNPEIFTITFKSASQVQKTTLGLGALMKWIDTDYHDLFCMIPRANDIKKFLEFKIKPMIDGSKVVKDKMNDYRQEETERKNSYFYKTAQNLLAIISANDTKSITAKYMLFDEASEFEASIITEALERAKTYSTSGYKALIVSTQIHLRDAINYFFNISEVKKQYFMYCIHCKGHYYPELKHLKFPSLDEYKVKMGIPKDKDVDFNEIQSDYKPYASLSPTLECPHCKEHMNDDSRRKVIMTNKLKWFQVIPTSVEADNNIVYSVAPNPKTKYSSVGFDINTFCIANVPLSAFVQKVIECEHADPSETDDLWDKFMVGYCNKVYIKESADVVEQNDILLLNNKLQVNEVPSDKVSLHVGVDLQKNRLYYTVGAISYGMRLDIVAKGELMSEGMGLDFIQLTDIIQGDYYDAKGVIHKVNSVGIDIRGFGAKTPSGELISRRAEAWNYIQQYIEELEHYGVLNPEEFIYPTMGFDKLPNDDSIRSKLRSYSKEDEVDGATTKKKLIVLDFSNIQIKARLFNMISRSIKKVKATDGDSASSYDRDLFFINQGIIDEAEARKDLPKTERGNKHSFEAHLVSEHLTFKIGANGKPALTETFEKIYEGVRNDYLDCCVSIVVQAMYKKFDSVERPVANTGTDDVLKELGDYFKSV